MQLYKNGWLKYVKVHKRYSMGVEKRCAESEVMWKVKLSSLGWSEHKGMRKGDFLNYLLNKVEAEDGKEIINMERWLTRTRRSMKGMNIAKRKYTNKSSSL